jgi:hypothetical protein
MPFLLKQDCFIVIVLIDIVNVLPCFAPPKTLFWTLFWGCDGCHRFLGVGGVGFGGVYEEILCQNQPTTTRIFVI